LRAAGGGLRAAGCGRRHRFARRAPRWDAGAMSSVPDFSQAPASAAVEDVTPPGSEPLSTTESEPGAEDAAEPAPDA
ncbi:hypothetical protein, partial [Kineococcus rubinsiae]|uniref:hypothetical protein n=1 Tax=Kineococcus rubinsiae TaxID=2609562 RepID=UPI001AD90954